MSVYTLSSRYAKSLLDLAVEKNQLEEINRDIRYFFSVTKNVSEFILLLKNPIIHTDKKLKIAEQLFKNKFNPITFAFIELVIKKRREAFLPQIVIAFIDQYNKVKNITAVMLTTAVEADEAVKEQVKKLIKEKANISEIELQTKVDENIIGGFILQYEDKMYDASIHRQLEILDDSFLENVYLKKY